jgi:ATP-binding cassette subfamily B protein
VLLLDNPTANLDAEIEAQLIETLLTLRGEHTIVVATQQLTLTRRADQVVVLDRGQVVEYGAPTSLLEAQGSYATLYAEALSMSATH